MYTAIVLLPLLGAVIAGLVSLFGSARVVRENAAHAGTGHGGHGTHDAHQHDAHDRHGHDDHAHGSHAHGPDDVGEPDLPSPGSLPAVKARGLSLCSAALASATKGGGASANGTSRCLS